MDKLDRNEMDNMTVLHGDRIRPFIDFVKTQTEFEFEQFELAVQKRREAKLDAIEHVVDDVFVHRHGLIPTVIAGTATTVPMKCSPAHLRVFSRGAVSTFYRKMQLRNCMDRLKAIARDGN